MKLVTSREAIAFLSQAAPRAWVQRLLRCMIIDGELYAYFSAGRIQPHTNVFHFTLPLREKAGEFSGRNMDRAIREKFEPELAEKLVGRDGRDRVNDDVIDWKSEDGHDAIDMGWIFFAEEIDWEAGTIKVGWVPTDRDAADWLFPSGEFFISEFESADYEADFEGMSFSYASIEMLLPSASLGSMSTGMDSAVQNRSRVGRPPKWDWEGALAHVVTKAQTPDGLPTGPGSQARIEEIMSEWFIGETGEAPSPSQVRERAAKIIRSLETPRTPEKR